MRCIHRYEMWFAIRTKDRGQAAETKWLRADVGNIGLPIGRRGSGMEGEEESGKVGNGIAASQPQQKS